MSDSPQPSADTGAPPAADVAGTATDAAQAPGRPEGGGRRNRGERGLRGDRGGAPDQPAAPAATGAAGAERGQRNPVARGERSERGGKGDKGGKGRSGGRPVHPLLHTLFTLYPGLFGARFLPLKVGVYEDLRAAHPEALPAEELKVALGLHTRSNRYLEAVASGLPRHDLQGQPTDPAAPEHVHHAILELYRRKASTPQEPAARERAVAQLVTAIERSGLGREGYRERFGAGADATRQLLDDALAVLGQQVARREALQRAFEASGASIDAFAEMYGLAAAEVAQLRPTTAT